LKNPEKLGSVVSGKDGVVFSVWAPHASAVSVVGDFNDWDKSAHPLGREGDVWSVRVSSAKVGSEYRFILATAQGELEKNDPRALAMTHSAGASVVVDHASFDWEDDASFLPPARNELVIYEMHLGTYFRGGNKQEPGTFDDAIERLDHLVDLGVNAIELMPIVEFAGGISWGYNPAAPLCGGIGLRRGGGAEAICERVPRPGNRRDS
jgi:1,4-alpha-glucan branching enzyme